MKKAVLFIITVLCIAVPDNVSAQRYLPGQRGLQFTIGTVNSLRKNVHCGIAYSTYTKNANRWVFGGEYIEKRYPYEDWRIPQSQFTAEGGYFVQFLSDAGKTFFLSVGASALAGYETVNWDKKLLPDGATLNHDGAFIYGGALTLEMEAFLTDRVILLANVRERLLGGSTVGQFNTLYGLGIKFIIN
jgi:hypothetical protein